MDIGLFLDIAIITSVGVAIIYTMRLSRKIAHLHHTKAEFEAFLQEFNMSVARAQEHVRLLKQLSDGTDSTLKDNIGKAREMIRDLSFLVDRAGHSADMLEHYIKTSRTIKPARSEEMAAKAQATAENSATSKILQTLQQKRAGAQATQKQAAKPANDTADESGNIANPKEGQSAKKQITGRGVESLVRHSVGKTAGKKAS